MAMIDMLLQGASTDEEKLRMQADALRGRRRAAAPFALSTIGEISGMAQQEQRDVMDAAKLGGTLRRDAMRDAEQRRQYDQTRADNLANQEANRALEKTLEQMKIDAKAGTDGKLGDLTPGQFQTGLNVLEKKVGPVQDILGRVAEIDSLLTPYTKEGEKSGRNIPGLGFIEGYRGPLGDAVRFVQGTESQQISSAMQGLLADMIREQAGLAQTLTETANVLRSLSQQGIASEEAALAAYPRVKEALARDLDRIKKTTYPQVMDFYESQFSEGGEWLNPFKWKPKDLDFSKGGKTAEEEELESTYGTGGGWKVEVE